MNFYRLIEQQYNIYKEYSLNSCVSCPCKILRDKVFGAGNRSISCLKEITLLMDKCNIHNNTRIFFCNDCRKTSVEIAKKLFGKKEFNKI